MANEFKIKNGFFSEGSSNITGSLTVSNGITGSLLGTATTASNITPAITNDADTRIITANGNGTLNAESLLTFDGTKLSVLYQSGDEGGEILLNKPVTNTTIAGTGVTVDIYQNKLRFFEQGGSARGYYLDITSGGAGAATNLASGGGTVTSVGGQGSVSGITLTGTVTASGSLTLGGSISGLTNSNLSGTAGITNANLANSSVTVGSTAIALGASATTIAGLSSVTSTTFVGALTGNASTATTATTANATTAALTAGTYLTSGGTFNGSTARTFAVDATDANTASKVVARDASGNFSAGRITIAGLTVTGSAIVTGSLLVRDGFSTILDTANFVLKDTSGTSTVDWGSRELRDTNNYITAHWEALYLATPGGAGAQTVRWGYCDLNDQNASMSIDWNGRSLKAPNGLESLNWGSEFSLASNAYQTDLKTTSLQEGASSVGVIDATYMGDTIVGKITSAGTGYPADGDVVYLDPYGFWYTYDETDSNVYGKMVGLVHKVETGPETCHVLLEGHVVLDQNSGPRVQSIGYGTPVYHRTSGGMTTNFPGSGIVQVLGHCYYQNTVNSDKWIMKFRPSMDWYKL
jgi:hypothetical protein